PGAGDRAADLRREVVLMDGEVLEAVMPLDLGPLALDLLADCLGALDGLARFLNEMCVVTAQAVEPAVEAHSSPAAFCSACHVAVPSRATSNNLPFCATSCSLASSAFVARSVRASPSRRVSSS